MTNCEAAVRRANALLRDRTPLWTDCGALCGARCCQGDENTGMHLLPGEGALLRSPGFTVREAGGEEYLICEGRCARDMRPFSCRIFPFFPVPVRMRSGRYMIRVLPDPRAFSVCPLLTNEDVRFDRRFLRAVGRAGRALMRCEETAKWLIGTADELAEIARLRDKLI